MKKSLPTVTCPQCRTVQPKQGQKTCTKGGCYHQFSLEETGVKVLVVVSPGMKELVLTHVRS